MPARLYLNARIWSAAAGPTAAPSSSQSAPDAIAERDGRIAAIGPAAQLQRQYPEAEPFDLGGRLVTPGLIDCHTHIVHAGNRAGEIGRRLAGESYESIAPGARGIYLPVTATRAATHQDAVDAALAKRATALAPVL